MLELHRSALNIYPLHPSRSDALSAFRVIFFFLDTPLCQPRRLIGIYWVQLAVLYSTGYLAGIDRLCTFEDVEAETTVNHTSW